LALAQKAGRTAESKQAFVDGKRLRLAK